jgi:hypothetical protein
MSSRLTVALVFALLSKLSPVVSPYRTNQIGYVHLLELLLVLPLTGIGVAEVPPKVGGSLNNSGSFNASISPEKYPWGPLLHVVPGFELEPIPYSLFPEERPLDVQP